jgi:tRNA(fMet)-specific endonuclease VapC
MIYLLDTGSCIGFLRNKAPKTIEHIRNTPFEDIALSSVVVFELLAGAAASRDPAGERKKIHDFARPFRSLEFDDNCAAVAGELRAYLEKRGEKIGPYDTLIAATALQHGITVVTGNTREFRRVPNLLVEDWEA